MSRIDAGEAWRVLGKWHADGTAICVAMSRDALGGREAHATLKDVLPHSQKALVSLQDENGDDVDVIVSLEGAEWELSIESALTATFANGNRYEFRERAEAR